MEIFDDGPAFLQIVKIVSSAYLSKFGRNGYKTLHYSRMLKAQLILLLCETENILYL